MIDDPRELQRAQDDLRALVRELCDGVDRPVLDDETGKISTHHEPPLLDQLRDAVGHSGESRRSSGRTSLPLNPDALDSLQRIETDAAELHRRAMTQDSIQVDARIRAVSAIAGRLTSIGMVASMIDTLTGFVKEIRGVLEPPRRYELVAPCPACGARFVWREQDGEQARVPALTVDVTVGCTCLKCKHVWPPAQFEHLALVIGVDAVEMRQRINDLDDGSDPEGRAA